MRLIVLAHPFDDEVVDERNHIECFKLSVLSLQLFDMQVLYLE